MSGALIAVAVIGGGLAFAATEKQASDAKKAEQEAKRIAQIEQEQAMHDKAEARRQKLFEESKGKGTGDIGVISTEVDSNIVNTLRTSLTI